jgi:hypothetical protein
MALDPVVNFFRSQIATLPVASGGTVIVLPTGDGNKLPNPATDGAFNLTIYNADDPFVTPEIVRVTGRSGDTLTVTRAQEGTSATNKTAGSTWSVELTPTAKTIQDIDSKKVEKTGDTMTGTLTATKLIPSGNVTAGNGMYLPAANTVAVSTNGAERLRILSSGEVGIGGVPVYPLSVIRTSGSSVIQIQGENNAESTLLFGDADSLAIGRIVYSHVNDSFRFWTNGVERYRVTSTGNVGIGTTAPETKLDVNGDVTITDKIIHSGDTDTAIRFLSNDFVSIETGGGQRLTASNSGIFINNQLSLMLSNNKQLVKRISTNNSNIEILNLSVPNSNIALQLDINIIHSRADNSLQGTMAHGKFYITIARTIGSSVVNLYDSTNSFVASGANAGGGVNSTLNTPTFDITGGSTDTQTVSIKVQAATGGGGTGGFFILYANMISASTNVTIS